MIDLTGKYFNLGSTVIIALISYAILHNNHGLDDAGYTGMWFRCMPLILGTAGLIMFLYVYRYSRNYAWIACWIANLININLILFVL